KLKMILAGGGEAYKVKDLLRSKSIPVILQPTLTLPLDEDDPYDRSLSQAAELADAHVKFAFGSFDNSFARRLGQQAANAVAYGLLAQATRERVIEKIGEHTSELQSPCNLVCRLLPEKKKINETSKS